MQGYIFYFTMAEWSLKVGKCLPPRAKAKAPATGYLPCSCNARERQTVPMDRAEVRLHITIFLHAPLAYLSSSTKRCTFPSASRWQQSQHTLSSATSAMQKVTYSKGTRQTASGDTISPTGFISHHLPECFDASRFGSKQSGHQGESRCREPPRAGIFNISPLGCPWHQAPGYKEVVNIFPGVHSPVTPFL